MLSIAELRSIVQARLEDAQILLVSHRHDGAIYLSGYAVELAEWSAVAYWDPEIRYNPVGSVSEAAAR